jgi:hypothetical protein
MIATRSTGRLGPFQQWKVTDSDRETPHELIGIVRLSAIFVSLPFSLFSFFGGQKPKKIYYLQN